MPMRNKVPLDILYLHVDVAHLDFATLRTTMKTAHESKGDFVLSVNTNDAGTEAVIKVVGQKITDVSGKAWSNAIIEVFPYARANEVLAMVNDPAWTGK